jgi:hypothetical protein
MKLWTLLGATLLVACGPSPAYYSDPIVELPTPVQTYPRLDPHEAHEEVATPVAKGQSWLGSYTCAQGETELALQIVNVQGPTVDAIFHFHHQPSGDQGSYKMTGHYSPRERRLELVAGEWIERPDRYVTVDMRGKVSADGSRFTGDIEGPGCGGFAVRRK